MKNRALQVRARLRDSRTAAWVDGLSFHPPASWSHRRAVARSFLVLAVFEPPNLRALLGLLALNAIESARAIWTLLLVDGRGTAESLGLTAGKFLIGILPLAVLAWRWSGWERLRVLFWLPILAVVFWPLAGGANVTLLTGLSFLAWWSSRFRRLRWMVILPLAVLGSPVANHMAGTLVWSGAPLFHRCQANAGRRPINLQPEHVSPGYMSVSQVGPDEVLLVGQLPDQGHLPFFGAAPHGPLTGGSWWLRRVGSDWKIDGRSKITSMAWKGCRIGDELWLFVPRTGSMVAVRRDPHTGVESLREIRVPSTALDFSEVVCLPRKIES
jgi:hypothetical protein